jgi:hypothetical protein
MTKIGKFTKVALREIWKHEALDFTQWLALEENLELLAQELGIGIMNAQTEVRVGQFAVDILAKDDNEHNVIIENQLEATNHDHLGKIITYAAGLQATTIVWIVAKAREEHQLAMNWLNENTDERVNCFLIELEAWKIDDSAPAPRFNIVVKPNNWGKGIKQSIASGGESSKIKLQQQEFWAKIKEYGEANAKFVKSWQSPRPQYWYNISIGTSKAHLSLTINSVKNQIGLELHIPDNKDLFQKLFSKQESIESQLGYKLDWQELLDKKASRVIITKVADFRDESQQEDIIQWAVENSDEFTKVFKKYL